MMVWDFLGVTYIPKLTANAPDKKKANLAPKRKADRFPGIHFSEAFAVRFRECT